MRLGVIRPARVARISGWSTGRGVLDSDPRPVPATAVPAGWDVAGAGVFSDPGPSRTIALGVGESAAGGRAFFASALSGTSCATDAAEARTGAFFSCESGAFLA